MKILIKRLFALLLVAGALYALSLQYIEELPPTDSIHPALAYEPYQGDTDVEPFNFEYRGTEYFIEPVHSYELSGLIVSHNSISSITDAYHNSDSVDFKDLCVVWGQNAKKDLLDQMLFWSEPWTCWTKPLTSNAQGRFFPDELSNNHLLARKNEVRELIKNAKVGDQIQLKGYLINYGLENSPRYSRKSSLVRTDTGNGACETIFVEEAKILREANPGWRTLHSTSKAFSMILLLLLPILWVWDIQTTFSQKKKDLEEKLKNSPQLRHKKRY